MPNQQLQPQVFDALVAVLSAGLIAFLTWAAAKFRTLTESLRRVEHQVKNHHQTNLRDDIDRNQEETKAHLKQVTETAQSGLIGVAAQIEQLNSAVERQGLLLKQGLTEHSNMQKDIGGLREEMRQERKTHGTTQERVYALEQSMREQEK